MEVVVINEEYMSSKNHTIPMNVQRNQYSGSSRRTTLVDSDKSLVYIVSFFEEDNSKVDEGEHKASTICSREQVNKW
jgi:hypothetical protein